eukprot:1178307-Prorocentrum_minimum.AAC.1
MDKTINTRTSGLFGVNRVKLPFVALSGLQKSYIFEQGDTGSRVVKLPSVNFHERSSSRKATVQATTWVPPPDHDSGTVYAKTMKGPEYIPTNERVFLHTINAVLTDQGARHTLKRLLPHAPVEKVFARSTFQRLHKFISVLLKVVVVAMYSKANAQVGNREPCITYMDLNLLAKTIQFQFRQERSRSFLP